jgi:hypothetical protein
MIAISLALLIVAVLLASSYAIFHVTQQFKALPIESAGATSVNKVCHFV